MTTAGSYQGIETAPDRPGYSVRVTDAAGHVWSECDPGWNRDDASRYALRTARTEPPGRTVSVMQHEPGSAPLAVLNYTTTD